MKKYFLGISAIAMLLCITSCGLDVKNKSDCKLYLCKGQFGTEKSAALTIKFSSDGTVIMLINPDAPVTLSGTYSLGSTDSNGYLNIIVNFGSGEERWSLNSSGRLFTGEGTDLTLWTEYGSDGKDINP